nr:MAG: ORF2 [Torque teno felis virus]
MEPPLPGPNLMLPAINLSCTPDLDSHLAYKKREAIWKRLVSDSHKNWCLCGSYLNHFQKCGDEKPDTGVSDAAMADIVVEGDDTIGDADAGGEDGDQRYFGGRWANTYLKDIEQYGSGDGNLSVIYVKVMGLR